VTDANLVLGRLGADRFLGGEMRLDLAAAERALKDKIAHPLGMDVTRAAEGILRIAATAMSYAVKGVTTERGLDAASFALVAYGGAGPLHASAVARELGIATVIVPRAPGHFSAFGMLFSDLRYDFVRTWFTPLDEMKFDDMEALYAGMEGEGIAAVRAAGLATGETTIARAADMRYIGQEHAVTVDLPASLFAARDRDAVKARFDAVHEVRYGTSAPSERAEIVSLRTTVAGPMKKPPLERVASGTAEPPAAARTGTRRACFAVADGYVDTSTFARPALLAGNAIVGPALIDEYASTTVVQPGDALTVDPFGNLVIACAGRRR
jgi:N-methylhydantoinase A